MNSSKPPGLNRRTFLRRTSLAAGVVSAGWAATGGDHAADQVNGVAIVCADDDPVVTSSPARWAAGQLQDALAARGVGVRRCQRLEDSRGGEFCVWVAGPGTRQAIELLDRMNVQVPTAPESLALAPLRAGARSGLVVCGRDTRGLVYALLELTDRVVHAADACESLRAARTPVVEQPANRIRSVARCFVSDLEDKPWFYDRTFWQRYLTMLATQRFNRFSLTLGIGYDFTWGIRDCYLHFAYPFLVSPPGYHVRAVPLSDAERERNLETLRYIGDETAMRGLHFQLALWTHAYQWSRSPEANYLVEGLTPEGHADYCRDALAALLRECPAIGGVTFRVHGESGVPEGSYDFWRTVFDALVHCGRRVEIDMHAKGMDQAMIDVALATGMPVNISPKYWAEHMGLPYMQGAIRRLELPPRDAKDAGFFARSSGSRSFLRYGYGDLLAEGRRHGVLHRIWPGTQRLLLWGDPDAARGYGRVSSFCGSDGLEIFEPLSFKGRQGSGLPGGRDAYADASLRPPGGDFEKYLHAYRLWGRCTYNPECEAGVCRRDLAAQFGRGAEPAETALAAASRILPLVTTAHCPSAANNNYWPEMYVNMPIVDEKRPHPYGDTMSPKRFGAVSPLDPEFFSRIDDCAADLLQGKRPAQSSPLEVARRLLDSAASADRALARARSVANDPGGAAFRRLAVDTAIQAELGRFFAWKLRAGVLFALHDRTQDRPALHEALQAYRSARAAWVRLSERSEQAYRRDISFGHAPHLRGHWLDRLPAIDADLADMERLLEQPPKAAAVDSRADPKQVAAAVRQVLQPWRPSHPTPPAGFHTPPKSFRRGQTLALDVSASRTGPLAKLAAVHLHYRRVNQAEAWQVKAMEKTGVGWRAVIEATYADSAFPIQYYFELRDTANGPWLYPGFWNRTTPQPYFVLRPT